MKTQILTTNILLISSLLFAADFELQPQGHLPMEDYNMANPAMWKIIGDSATGFPSKDDNMIFPPYNVNSNTYIRILDPKGYQSSELEIKNFTATMASASSIFNDSATIKAFVISGDFRKSATVKKNDQGQTVSCGIVNGENDQANLAIVPALSAISVEIKGDVFLLDEAINRTSNMVLGGSHYFGKFRDQRENAFLNNFCVRKNINIKNTKLYITTKDGLNARIEGVVNFEAPSGERQGVLFVNSDNSDNGYHLSQIIQVGGLNSVVEGSGIITTTTGMQRIKEIDPLSKEGETADAKTIMQKKIIGDEIIREGTIEIIGIGGNFSGEIRDNFSGEDKRGKVNVVMDSPEETQILSGNNAYTGKTIVNGGTLILNFVGSLGDVIMRDGKLKFMQKNPTIKSLNWSGGGFDFDFTKDNAITIEENISVSTMPEAFDTFNFSNIKKGKAYTLFTFKNKKEAFSNFLNKKIEYKDSATGKDYECIFGVSDSALTVLFLAK